MFENIIAFWRNLGKGWPSFELIIYGHIFYKLEKLNKSQYNSNHRVLCQVSFPFCLLQIFSFLMCKRYMGNQNKYLLLSAHWLEVLPFASCSMPG